MACQSKEESGKVRSVVLTEIRRHFNDARNSNTFDMRPGFSNETDWYIVRINEQHYEYRIRNQLRNSVSTDSKSTADNLLNQSIENNPFLYKTKINQVTQPIMSQQSSNLTHRNQRKKAS